MFSIAESRETTLQDFLTVVFHRKWIIIPVVLVASVFVIFLNTRQPTVYESISRVLVRRGEQTSVFTPNVKLLGWEEEVSSQIEIIRSAPVMERTREILGEEDRLEGVDEGRAFNPGGVRAGVVGESNVLWIAYSDFHPEFARVAVNAVTDAYMEYYNTRAGPPGVEDFFEKEIERIEGELAELRARKTDFLEENRILEFDGLRRILFERIRDTQRKLDGVQEDISESRATLDRLDEFARGLETPSMPTVEGGSIQQTVFKDLLGELTHLRSRRQDLLAVYTPSHHEVRAVDNQIEVVEERFRSEIRSFRDSKENELEILEARRDKLAEIIASARDQLAELPLQELRLKEIDQKLSVLESDYEQMQKKRTEARISIASTPAWSVTLISPASAPFPKNTKDYVRMALGPILSLIVGLGLAFFWDSLDRSLKSVREAEEYLSLPVLAVVAEKRRGRVPSPGFLRLFSRSRGRSRKSPHRAA